MIIKIPSSTENGSLIFNEKPSYFKMIYRSFPKSFQNFQMNFYVINITINSKVFPALIDNGSPEMNIPSANAIKSGNYNISIPTNKGDINFTVNESETITTLPFVIIGRSILEKYFHSIYFSKVFIGFIER